jgi:hypothetical protein
VSGAGLLVLLWYDEEGTVNKRPGKVIHIYTLERVLHSLS